VINLTSHETLNLGESMSAFFVRTQTIPDMYKQAQDVMMK